MTSTTTSFHLFHLSFAPISILEGARARNKKGKTSKSLCQPWREGGTLTLSPPFLRPSSSSPPPLKTPPSGTNPPKVTREYKGQAPHDPRAHAEAPIGPLSPLSKAFFRKISHPAAERRRAWERNGGRTPLLSRLLWSPGTRWVLGGSTSPPHCPRALWIHLPLQITHHFARTFFITILLMMFCQPIRDWICVAAMLNCFRTAGAQRKIGFLMADWRRRIRSLNVDLPYLSWDNAVLYNVTKYS